MEKKEIMDALARGDYRITHDCACDCAVNDITEEGIEESGNECWQSMSLYIGDTLIAEYIQHNSRKMHTSAISDKEISDDIWDEMYIFDDADNPAHNTRQLVQDYLEGLEGWRFYRDNLRNFANEYTIILVSPDIKSVDDENISELAEDWDTLTAEEAASEMSYDGDSATQAYNSIRIIS